MSKPRSVSMWTAPVALGLLTAVGLVTALFSDGGMGDHLANVCLGIPVVACIWYGWIRRKRSSP